MFWEKFWYKNIWLKVDLAQSYGRKRGFRGIFGNSSFFLFLVGWEKVRHALSKGDGFGSTLGKLFLYWYGLVGEGLNFFWNLFWYPLTSLQNLGIFWKKIFFIKNFVCYPLWFFAEIHVSIFFSKVRWPKILKFLHKLYYNNISIV